MVIRYRACERKSQYVNELSCGLSEERPAFDLRSVTWRSSLGCVYGTLMVGQGNFNFHRQVCVECLVNLAFNTMNWGCKFGVLYRCPGGECMELCFHATIYLQAALLKTQVSIFSCM